MTHFAPWTIQHVDLSEGLPALRCGPHSGGLYVVFWWRDRPLGHAEIAAELFPLTRAQLVQTMSQAVAPAVLQALSGPTSKGRHKTDRLSTLQVALTSIHRRRGGSEAAPATPGHAADASIPMSDEKGLLRRLMQDSPPRSADQVSVVVCTRDRPERLRRCLASLARLDPAPREIVVVDNAPQSDATRRVVEQAPGVRYVLEPEPGLSHARNAGVRNSTGEIIAFTDDDVETHLHWAGRIQQGFAHLQVAATTGLVLVAELEQPSQLIFERHWSFNRGYCTIDFDQDYFEGHRGIGAPVWEIGAGANMAFRRRVLEEVGPFEPLLGPGTSGCGDDSEMWYRILAAGFDCRYDPAAVVFHYHRVTASTLQHQLYHYMRGHVAALLLQHARYRHNGNLYRAGVLLPRYYLRRLLRRLYWGADVEPPTLWTEIAGCAAGVSYYLRHCRQAVRREKKTALQAERPPVKPLARQTTAAV